ncbi:MAG: Low specificity phosphatase (HAD superfamily)-like protein [Candidatus Magasanikbacteria bacterium GW2011_GWA2_42_32]|uniref:Low specificity phosphatase (HAD superfamily)-like protein n=1 Tax=Candidatus Magasanikbacteria bacterium GW2011_GWA2_42_32 TaxID=1619039 RepID=A0A0G1A4U6_9BACT|nr:MAG: Low specificity phosphatase (HAD superfamily)-like protein [Candidatus Magasanikbacteria bacterium GW2011_GWA2_42_32]
MKNFVLDADGVLTDGQFHYTVEGKTAKIFGPDDADAILLLKPYLNIIAITGDKKGFAITKKRVADDMKIPLYEVSTFERVKWLKENGYNLEETIYMGDGIFDAMVFAKVAYSIAPANAIYTTKEKANFVTPSRGGDSAVAEACLHILEKFFTPFDPTSGNVAIKGGEWGS